MFRPLAILLAALALLAATPSRAQGGGFDLAGPELSVTVSRGGAELPVAAVPSLSGGDRLAVRAALPPDQSARYILVVAFLRGATNPPPKNWFFKAETWNREKDRLDLVVPEGAEQAVLFLAPEAGGGFDSVRDAVRGRPGVFVRAAQDLHQASLDRARLDAFVSAVERVRDAEPERLAAVAPTLADTLRIRLNAECLARQRSLQAACLTQNRDALVLQAGRGATLTETLTGAPVDLAYRVAATPEGGAGYYSPYIGLARDLARLFGAFRSAQYQYLPALALGRGGRLALLLNTAPSFRDPRSVLVAALPPIGPAPPPAWRAGAGKPVCLARPDLAVPLEDAALLFATDYARDLSLRITAADGRVAELPVVADVERGGVRPATGARLPAGPVAAAVLGGRWGFDPFTGPRLPVQLDAPGAWTPRPDGSVVVGRDHPLTLRGGASACVESVALVDAGGGARPVAWKATAPDEMEVVLPLARARPGPLTLLVARYGAVAPATVALTGLREASRLDRFTVHAGDRAGVLEGARLDQVASLELGGRRFTAGALARGAEGDRLELETGAPVEAGEAGRAAVRLRDGRTLGVAATLAPPRPQATLVSRAVAVAPTPGTPAIELPDGVATPAATLTFSVRMTGDFGTGDAVEVATEDGSAAAKLTVASGALRRVGDVAVAGFAPEALLGAGVAGPLRFRVLRDGAAGDWRPLARVVRLPTLHGLDCPAGAAGCTLTGRDLFLVAAVGGAPDLRDAVALPPGFVGSAVALPRPAGRALYLRLHDAPDAVFRVALPA